MLWTDAHFRGCGLCVDWLRDRWFYACLVRLESQPMSPSELLRVFQLLHPAALQIFGPHTVYPESVTRHLVTLARGGLVRRGPLCGRRREYSVTPLGAELLDSLSAATAYGCARYEWLVRCSRERQRMDPDAPFSGHDPASLNVRRRSTALLFGTILGPKWSYASLAALTWGSLRFSQIAEVVNQAAAASQDVVSGYLVDSVLTARLETLRHLGLVAWNAAEPGRHATYVLTGDGRALMMALEPMAAFGIRRDAEMTAVVRAM